MNWKNEWNKPFAYYEGNKIITLKEYVIIEKLKNEIEILPVINRKDITPFIQKHYLHKFPSNIKKAYAIYHKQTNGGDNNNKKQMIGIIVYGLPLVAAGKFLQPLVNPDEILELKRLFIDDIGLRNIESHVIGRSLKDIRQNMPEIKAVITFADEKAGHIGSIYQATNAIYLGKTDNGKHKYIYIMHDKDKNTIGQLIKPQTHPKKQSPVEETKSEQSYNSSYKNKMDMLAQIKRELQSTGKLPPDSEPPDAQQQKLEKEKEEERKRNLPYKGYQGAQKSGPERKGYRGIKLHESPIIIIKESSPSEFEIYRKLLTKFTNILNQQYEGRGKITEYQMSLRLHLVASNNDLSKITNDPEIKSFGADKWFNEGKLIERSLRNSGMVSKKELQLFYSLIKKQ